MKTFTSALIGAAALAQDVNSSPLSGPAGLEFPNVTGLMNHTVHVSNGGSAHCVSGTVKVNATTDKNLKFAYNLPSNQSQVTQTLVSLWSSGGDGYVKSLTSGTQRVTGSFDIEATYCLPAGENSKTTKVQLLTHGIGVDRYYWDFASGYSYVDTAAAAGYATFLYNRLGVGASSKEDPLNAVQSPLELEILEALASKLRQGTLGDRAFSTVVGVGHSFGSILTQGVTAAYPKTLDAAVLTGFTLNSTGLPGFGLGLNAAIASETQPYRFSGLSAGYLVAGTPVSNQIAFFYDPGFDPEILSLADATKGSFTLGELFTLTHVLNATSEFQGPVAVVAGNEDLPFCNGNCGSPTNILADLVPALYPELSEEDTATYVAPAAGHALNLHYAAPGAFNFIQDFLKKHNV
ncbi:Alpha/Beta hydrolase protein [Aspergillus flavus]|uniref:Alpha/Beta hydrolase protein n=1 Tax=Aspergillus flavus (strain ATCC 200026 / FGSC A1120 / IAM 13836 / NRRL 3357 / JCM 12722 / SRRC 167) TaxID=332952 RepID=A0A7U2QYR5_ASPFN|nr:uncharacterized protein G4B84_006305 [Aspergillus flavus NRRL3357]KAF7625333.1 hypothetical protein AFLA_002202 [Aspergillus flavus NRRL3357]QMW30924.1 hypothetical protein G4B84_006305 [Aspergillus flavus NRRL3357]QRD89833.1 Alpha/Beta hydrolase protein [Aspergillus flavus]